ncbi:MAG: pyridoxal phosphate-dependent aminotransferase [Oscillospiraceae bacterium]|nr:pyridoxal phosphate-dependent aminotransferase [Oscillospiraceae bacterium]MDD6503755.1 pyridoxal phosphate-dependent aminotransferase [Oscillospiraceae bacterium]MDY4104789.1 pyridoxal phosphate-dependent aminotransferase [Oscillospiraceae bacterium]
MKPLSTVASAVKASTTLMIDSKAKQMKADGLDVVGFGAGEPDFNTPDNIQEAGIAAIREGKTRYTPAAGIVPLRQAIADSLKRDLGVDYDYTQIVVSSGAKHNLYITLSVLINPGDEVILPAPFWLSYDEMVRMVGGVTVIVNAPESQNFKITAQQLEAAITPRTKAFILNNPSNPTGMLYSREELEALAAVCVKHDLYIISDEIYFKLLYDGRTFTSVAALGEEVKERTILINGVSKSYAMTGWRIGYAAAPANIAKVMSNFLSHSTGSASTISQWAAVEAFNGPQDTVEAMRKVFEERRNYIVQRMNSIDGVSCIEPEGAFYVMMNIEQLKGRTLGGTLIETSDDFAMAFLEKELVAVVPCTGFGAPDFVRWTYATSMENIKEGLDRLERFLKA